MANQALQRIADRPLTLGVEAVGKVIFHKYADDKTN